MRCAPHNLSYSRAGTSTATPRRPKPHPVLSPQGQRPRHILAPTACAWRWSLTGSSHPLNQRWEVCRSHRTQQLQDCSPSRAEFHVEAQNSAGEGSQRARAGRDRSPRQIRRRGTRPRPPRAAKSLSPAPSSSSQVLLGRNPYSIAPSHPSPLSWQGTA